MIEEWFKNRKQERLANDLVERRRWFINSHINRTQQCRPDKSIEDICKDADYAWKFMEGIN